jgi:TRAP-type C4-dicarboxylate transport system permease small subunit
MDGKARDYAMKKSIVVTLVAFALGALSFIAVAIVANTARSTDTEWGIDGVTPMWPVAVSIGAMNLMALSVVVLVMLAFIRFIRDALADRRTRAEA